jgi:eukaryotic-like serine/threonine-protein kinase
MQGRMAAPAEELVQRALERVGRTLNDKWYLDALLGAGGMAAVYRGAHKNGGNQAAIKVLHPELAHDVSVRRRFLQEGWAANAVDHEGAVTVLDDGETEEGELYLVMELLSGMSVQTRWEKLGRRFSHKEALSVAHSVLDILAAAHDKGILHRDVKPENVFVTKDKRIKLLDFGLARLRDAPRARRSSSGGKSKGADVEDESTFETPATTNGQLIGTVSYMPPEQALARVDEVDARSDVWAVGALIFTLLAGRTVHLARTPHEHLLLAATKPAAPLASIVTGVPEVICAVVDRALEFKREDRWPDARSMQKAVEKAYVATEKERKA